MNTASRTISATSCLRLNGAFAAIAVVPFAIQGAAIAAAAVPFWMELGPVVVRAIAAPVIYALALVVLSGLLARCVAGWIEAGTFERSEGDFAYVARRLYGTCWTTVYYCKPVYFLALSVPLLKRAMFRLFGYRGTSANFTIYPDAWVRDLPLLDFAEGVYVSNRATIGTNVVRPGGTIHVDCITLGPRTIVGHLAMLAPGVRAGEDCEIGVGSAVGFKVRLGDRVRIGGKCVIDHAVRIGDGTTLGHCVLVGLRSRIGAGLRLPGGLVVPDYTSLETQDDVDRLVARERGECASRGPVTRKAG